jgi:hypothetical protein
MAKNPYFKDYSGEQNIIEDLSIEIIKAMGRDMLYIPREQYNKNIEFGEAQYRFSKSFPLEMYIQSVSGFEGEGDIISKFGLEVRDKVTLIISKKRFNREIAEKYDGITRPREGDLIYFPLTNGLFEINFVEHENPFYQAGKLYTYSLICELTTIDDDEFATGETDIDVVVTQNRAEIDLFSTSTQISTNKIFYDGETVYQVKGITGASGGTYANATAEAHCVKFYPTSITMGTMEVYGISCSFLYNSQSIRGKNSGAEYYVTGITGTNLVIPISPIDSLSSGDNESIKDTGDTLSIYDFTDIDPFSEGIY